jgi:hypothetical protein
MFFLCKACVSYKFIHGEILQELFGIETFVDLVGVCGLG